MENAKNLSLKNHLAREPSPSAYSYTHHLPQGGLEQLDKPHCIHQAGTTDSKLIVTSSASSEQLQAMLLHTSSNQLLLCTKHYHELYRQFYIPHCALVVMSSLKHDTRLHATVPMQIWLMRSYTLTPLIKTPYVLVTIRTI